MGLQRTVILNSLALFVATIGMKLMMLALALLVINHLDDGDVARFGTAFALAMLLSGSADFGGRLLLLRELGGWRDSPHVVSLARRLLWLTRAVTLRVSAAGALIILAWFALTGASWGFLGEAALFALFGYADALTIQGRYALRGLHRAHHEIALTLTGRGLTLGAGTALVATGQVSVAAVGGCFLLGSVMEVMLTRRALEKELRAIRPPAEAPAEAHPPQQAQRHPMLAHLMASAPFGIALTFSGLMQRLPFLVMPGMSGLGRSLDALTAAVKLPEAAAFLPSNLMTPLIPALRALKTGGRDGRRTLWAAHIIEFMATVGAVVACLMALEATTIVSCLFRPGLEQAAPPLALLSAWLGLLFLERAVGSCLIASGGERANLAGTCVGLAGAVVAAVFFLPGLGATGGAMVMIAGQALHVATMMLLLPGCGIRLRREILWRPLVVGLATFTAWVWIAGLFPAVDSIPHMVIRCLVVGNVAIAVYVMMGWPNRHEDPLMQMISRKLTKKRPGGAV